MHLQRLLVPPAGVVDAWGYFPTGLAAPHGLARPLGRAFERVVRAAILAHADLTLVAEHVPIWGVDAQGKRQSVGELDFVVWDARRQQLMHWEVAFKYYLGQVQAVTLPDGRVSHWPGPRFQDCLERKWDKLTMHQSLLSKRYPDAVRLALQESMQNRMDEAGDLAPAGHAVWLQAPIVPAMLVAGLLVDPAPLADGMQIPQPDYVDVAALRLTAVPVFDLADDRAIQTAP